MRVDIMATESLGVRGLCCVVEIQGRKIVVDPGLALGYQREGLLPHPAQVAVGEEIRELIIAALQTATDVVMSHYHGDHVPLLDANPYQLQAQRVAPLSPAIRLWAKGRVGLSPHMVHRRIALAETLDRQLPDADDLALGALSFSPPLPHGEPDTHLGTVIMTRVEGEDAVFVHASDIQLLDEGPVTFLLDWHPDIALVGGPPLYLSHLSLAQRETAWEHALQLARHIDTLILDHHLLRSEEGLSWLERLSLEAGRPVLCAADFMGRPRCLLEARRVELYREMPVPDGWHEAYACGDVGTEGYQAYWLKCRQISPSGPAPVHAAGPPLLAGRAGGVLDQKAGEGRKVQ
jgi:predicted metallo-beta-lactamase superfamily hydrolase